MIRPVFLLSPAHCGGKRAQLVLREQASFDLAVRLRTDGATLGEVFTFLSGLYFRGKLTYAEHFGRALVIAPGWGLVPAQQPIRHGELEAIARIGVAPNEARFADPLARDATALDITLDPGTPVVLLGSIATGKYVDVLDRVFGERLLFPAEFVGRGDMSRGGLLLRAARTGEELAYRPVAGAVRRGSRPPRLERVP
jgi:hypothetical protein